MQQGVVRFHDGARKEEDGGRGVEGHANRVLEELLGDEGTLPTCAGKTGASGIGQGSRTRRKTRRHLAPIQRPVGAETDRPSVLFSSGCSLEARHIVRDDDDGGSIPLTPTPIRS